MLLGRTGLAALSLLALCAPSMTAAVTSSAPGCTHQTAFPVPGARKKVGLPQICGIGISGPDGVFRIAVRYCPTSIITVPNHDECIDTAGSGTRCETTKMVPVTRELVHCKTTALGGGWILELPKCVNDPPMIIGFVPIIKTVGC